MEVLFAIPLLFLPFLMPFIAGQMAKSFGRNFWRWFFIGIPLPFIANIILLCLPDKSKKTGEPETKESENTPGRLVSKENFKQKIDNQSQYSTRA